MKKRILSFTLTLVVLLALLPVAAPSYAEEESVSLFVTIRDFKQGDKILFENYNVPLAHRPGLVKDKLGADKKPVYNSQLWFDTWPGCNQADLDAFFNDVPGVNMSVVQELVLKNDGKGFFEFRSGAFFPIDNMLFGNEGHPHNYHFSLEAHAEFVYQGFEVFEFAGDDDVWVFIDGTLVIDIGGVHTTIRQDVSLPDLVAEGVLDLKIGQTYDFDFFYMERRTSGSNLNIRTNMDLTYKPLGAGWATEELEQADALGLIPDSLRGADLTRPITRREFAGVVVKLFENLTDTKVTPIAINPFSDTSDTDVLKALNANLMVGIGGGLFAPDRLLNRQEAATALTRVFKRSFIEGWTFANDESYKIIYTMPALFADDANISGWARDSVYFMAANGIVKGKGGNMFAPRNMTSAEEAGNYAGSMRQEAIIMSYRLVVVLKDKGLEYTGK